MFPFQISSSYFEPKISNPEMSSSFSDSAESASTYSDSASTMSTTSSAYDSSVSPDVKSQQGLMAASSSSSDYQPAIIISPRKPVHKSPACFFDPSTCQRRQVFSIPEKIVYYIAKNVTNAKTYQKLVETCKYFFKVNPVIVVYQLICHRHEWDAYDEVDGEYRVRFKYDESFNFKVWVTHKFCSFFGDASLLIPLIYKNDAMVVSLRSGPLKFEDFLFLAANAEELLMWNQVVKYENGEIVQLEDVVKNLPKLKILKYEYDGSGVNSNTVKNLMELEHFKNISEMKLYNFPEDFDAEEMFKYITENRHVYVYLCYRRDISDAYKQLVQEYSRRLDKEFGCVSVIKYDRMIYGTGMNE